ncbi:hypothetical protein HPP92_018920 [Vanilla planifolia]|uniref:Uncharacterized protein n=1 Tax=Vanilla planifolia TaxID=51239 RepID=A0A835Q3F2_VANPL|nr:hypothetical protein HPP92_019495 [Vanilla planifolia]KAG0464756.1 hypothetical protein HPP92_018920 [Vanilla planifolia]
MEKVQRLASMKLSILKLIQPLDLSTKLTASGPLRGWPFVQCGNNILPIAEKLTEGDAGGKRPSALKRDKA